MGTARDNRRREIGLFKARLLLHALGVEFFESLNRAGLSIDISAAMLILLSGGDFMQTDVNDKHTNESETPIADGQSTPSSNDEYNKISKPELGSIRLAFVVPLALSCVFFISHFLEALSSSFSLTALVSLQFWEFIVCEICDAAIDYFAPTLMSMMIVPSLQKRIYNIPGGVPKEKTTGIFLSSAVFGCFYFAYICLNKQNPMLWRFSAFALTIAYSKFSWKCLSEDVRRGPQSRTDVLRGNGE